MNTLTALDLPLIAAGRLSFVESMRVAVRAYTQTAKFVEDIQPLLAEATNTYAKIGCALSQHLFDITHPNSLRRKPVLRD